MTYEEAYKYFKRRLSLGQCGKATTQRYAFEEAIESLEKQIPKKPIDDYRYKPKICPFCHTFLENYQSFCDNCGQAIDWSEE